METGIRIFAVANFAIVGLSHIVAHRAWAEFFERLTALGKPGALANGMLSLLFGSLVVGFHNVWHGPSVVLTLIGWACLVKSAVILVHPAVGVRSMSRVSAKSSWMFVFAGILLLVAAGVILLDVL